MYNVERGAVRPTKTCVPTTQFTSPTNDRPTPPSIDPSTHPPSNTESFPPPPHSAGGSSSLPGLLRPLTSTVSGARGNKHFAPVEVKDGVAIIRIDGPGKMNTIDDDFRAEIDALWEVRLWSVCV